MANLCTGDFKPLIVLMLTNVWLAQASKIRNQGTKRTPSSWSDELGIVVVIFLPVCPSSGAYCCILRRITATILRYSSAVGVPRRPEPPAPGCEMRSRRLQARDPENCHPIYPSEDGGMKGKLADREPRPAKSQEEVQAASFPSLCIRVCGWRARRGEMRSKGVRAAASAPKNKACKGSEG